MTSKTQEQRILEHIGLYTLTLRPILDHMFFDDQPNACANVLKSLKQKGLIVHRHELHGRQAYYQLTKAGAIRAGLTTAVAAPILSRLHEKISILWFSILGDTPRTLITKPDLKQLLPDSGAKLNAPHCLERAPDKTFCLYRVRVVKSVKPANLLKDLRRYIKKALSETDTRTALLDGHYGFALLSESKDRLIEFKQLVKENNVNTAEISSSRTCEIPFLYSYAPGIQTIGAALNGFKKS